MNTQHTLLNFKEIKIAILSNVAAIIFIFMTHDAALRKFWYIFADHDPQNP